MFMLLKISKYFGIDSSKGLNFFIIFYYLYVLITVSYKYFPKKNVFLG